MGDLALTRPFDELPDALADAQPRTLSETTYRVRCTNGCLSRLLLGRWTAEHAGRKHYDRTGHAGVIEPVVGGDTIQIGGEPSRLPGPTNREPSMTD